MSRLSKSEWRWRRAETLYELEMVFREEGWSSEEFVYDDEQDLYRFPDGEFAFSKEYANERRLREMGCIGQPVPMGNTEPGYPSGCHGLHLWRRNDEPFLGGYVRGTRRAANRDHGHAETGGTGFRG